MARDGEDNDEERWLAAANDAWRRACAEPSPFRRDALFEETAAAMVRAMSQTVRAYCLRHANGDATRAADLAQESFITFWRMLPRFEGRSSLKTFLIGITHNICRHDRRDGLRSDARMARDGDALIEELGGELGPLPDERLAAHEQQAALRVALQTLDARDTWLLWSRAVDQLGYAELLPDYQARFGAHITTTAGLRTAFFNAKRRLLEALRGGAE